MKVGDLVKLKYPRHPYHGDSGVIIETEKGIDSEAYWIRVIWSVAQSESWLGHQQIEVINERTGN